MNPDHKESAEVPTTKKGSRKRSNKDTDEASAKKKSKRSKAKTDGHSDSPSVQSEEEEMIATLSPLFPLSPPTSDENSIDLPDFLPISDIELPTDSNSSLGVRGVKIEAPRWWDNLNLPGLLDASGSRAQLRDNVDIAEQHPWSEAKCELDDAMATLDDVDYMVAQSLTRAGLAM